MTTLAQLTGANRRTYRQILHDPIVTDLRRESVRSLLETLGQVKAGPAGGLHITRNGHRLALPGLAAQKTETRAALLSLRRFLLRSETPPHGSNGREAHLLLVIGHHEARVYRSAMGESVPQQLLPSPHRAGSMHLDSTGKETPPPDAAFEPIAEALRATGNILIFGESSASQREMDQFVIWLKHRHADLADRIIGSMVLKHDQVTASSLLAKARDYHSRTPFDPPT